MRKIVDKTGWFFYRLKGRLLSSDTWVFVWKTVGTFQTKSQTFAQSLRRLRFVRDSAVFSQKISNQLLLNTANVAAFFRKAGTFVPKKPQLPEFITKPRVFSAPEKLRAVFFDFSQAIQAFFRKTGDFVSNKTQRFAKITEKTQPVPNVRLHSPKIRDVSAVKRHFPKPRITFTVNRQVVVRAVSVTFLSYAFLSMSFQPDAGQKPELFPVLQTAEIGMGGGDLGAGKTADEGLEESLLSGVLEPESFSKPRTLLYSSYKVQQGDIIGDLAAGFGLNQDTLISLNNIKNARLLQIGQTLKVPNQDGIMYTVKRGDTVDTIAEKYKSSSDAVKFANELFLDTVPAGTALFIPGAKLDWMERQEIYGDLFMWPVSGYITSNYGYRGNPFGGNRQFHSGLDIGAPIGTPVRAAMSGRVSSVSYDAVLGNYIVVTHHSGYRTMYGHLSVARVKTGAYVGTGERIGDVGVSGLTTGPHVHFTVYKNGVTVNPRTLMR